MAAIEADLGVSSTWYIRWRTADVSLVDELRSLNCAVGLHYETLTRQALTRGLTAPAELRALVPAARWALRAELAAFATRFGPCLSACPHGDTRVPAGRNAWLLAGERLADYGIRADATETMRGRSLGLWLTDRTRPEGGWQHGQRAHDVLTTRLSPILCLTHPNNWCSGAALWTDRCLRRVLGAPIGGGGLPRTMRTGSDQPPI
jgi:hypothetical protein